MSTESVVVGRAYGPWEVVRKGGRRWYCRCSVCGAARWLLRQSLVYPGRVAVCRHRTDADAAAAAHVRRLRLKAYSVRRRCGSGSYAGVELHPSWAEDLDAFVAYMVTLDGWDDARLTLDRTDPHGGYIPGNLRFATAREQRANQRRMLRHCKNRSTCDRVSKGPLGPRET